MTERTPTPIMPLSVGLKDAARMLGLSSRTVWAKAKSGEIRSFRDKRRLLFAVDDLRGWVQAKRASGVASGE